MPTLVIILRVISALAFAGPGLIGVGGLRRERRTSARESGPRAPVAANIAAFVLFFVVLFVFSGSSGTSVALPLALSGCLLAIVGAALVVRSRADLGSAWSFVPKADQTTGLVTTGPYQFVRHPIYAGLILLTLGQALAFSNWVAGSIALLGIVPTFAWRARAEERVLSHTFGEAYPIYQRKTKMIIPYLLLIAVLILPATTVRAQAETHGLHGAPARVGIVMRPTSGSAFCGCERIALRFGVPEQHDDA